MKNWIKVIGMIAVTAVIGLAVASCDTDPAHTCSFNNWTQTTAPTCVAKGIETGSCSCGAATTRDGADIDPDAHDLEPTENNTATCTEGGFGELACTRCEHTEEGAATPELGHAPGNWLQTTEPTCTEDGTETGTCTRDGCNEPNTPRKGEDKLGHYKNGRDCTNLCFDFGMVLVEKGTFLMGPDIWNNNATVEIEFTKDFNMSKYQVTQELYLAVMETNPSYFHGGSGREPAEGEVQGRRPVEQVSWYDVIVFCNRLSTAEDLSPAYEMPNQWPSPTSWSTDTTTWGTVPTSANTRWDNVRVVNGSNGYRLPTEAQWEYAAKGGNGSPGSYTYSGSDDPNLVAWYNGKTGMPTLNRTHEVGLLAPNGLDIYDMSGNVWEWCWDWWGNYTNVAKTDPTGADSGTNRVLRGGSWYNSAGLCRSALRYWSNPSIVFSYFGFRLVRP